MNPLQYVRWRWGTRRAALSTIRHLRTVGANPESLVDAGARNSEFMRYLAKAWPRAEVHSYEPDGKCHPIGKWHRTVLGRNYPLAHALFVKPALLKVDCDKDTVEVLRCADLTAFEWAVIEVTEDAPAGWPVGNNRSEISEIMAEAGFGRSKAVDAVVCLRDGRVAQTDVLFWRAFANG